MILVRLTYFSRSRLDRWNNDKNDGIGEILGAVGR